MLSANQMWPLLKQTGSDWLEDKAPKLAASLALYAMLSLAPMLVIIIKIAGMVYGDEAHKVEQAMEGVMPGAGADAMREMVQKAGEKGSGFWATVIAVLIAAFGATGVFGELQDSMNTIWEVKPKPNQGIWGFIRTRFLSLAMVLGLGFLLMISTVGTTLITTVGDRFSGGSQVIGYILSTVVSLGVMTVLFGAIYKLLPDAKVQWSDVWVGAVTAAVLFEIGKHLLSWYLSGATEVYGAAASLAALLLWIYYSAQILFFGAELTQAYAATYGSGIQPAPHAMPMTDEARRQQGMEPKGTAKSAGRGGAQRQPQFAGTGAQPRPARQVVTIEQPAQMNRQGYLLAAGGLAAGVIVGAAGVMTGRKWGEPKLTALQINQRLDALENRLGQAKSLKVYGKELALAERVAEINERVADAAASLKKTVNPPWYVKLAQPRNKKPPTGWYSRIKEYVG